MTLGAAVANLILNATAADDLVRLGNDAAAGQTLLESVGGTFANVAFVNPTASLMINLGGGDDRITIETLDGAFSAAFDGGDGRDRIEFDGTVATRGHDLKAGAEVIAVGPGSVLRTDLGADGAVADMVLAAADASTDALGAADSSVTVADATLIGRNITITATATYTVNADFIDGASTATVAIADGSQVFADRTLRIDVRSLVVVDGGRNAGAAGDTVDAAPVEVTMRSTAAARIDGAAMLTAGEDVAIDVVNAVDVTAAGTPIALVAVALETTALVEGGATVTGRDVSLSAASEASFAAVGAVADFESATRAGVADETGVRASGALLISAISLNRTESTSYAEAAIDSVRAILGLAGDDANSSPPTPCSPVSRGIPHRRSTTGWSLP